LAEDTSAYPAATAELGRRGKELAPEIHGAFERFSRAVFSRGALEEKTKQLIAVAVAHVTQCPYFHAVPIALARSGPSVARTQVASSSPS
jgi:alkylhydroperoxidase/carboxymuconolactone decarboxylase family protein YurZ